MSFSDDIDVRLTDSALRDGSHAIRHEFVASEVRAVVAALDDAGMPVIEVTHGDGLGGSSFTYGFSRTDERELIRAAVEATTRSRIAVLMLPGVGVMDDIRAAHDLGASVVRIATHCTEADIAVQHFDLARAIGMETVGFLMMAHSQAPETLATQARVMADAGCQCVYVVDSAGALILEQAADRVAALVAELGTDAQVGFHAHENLGLGVANTILAIRAGAVQVDGSTRRFGAGAGNAPSEALVAVCSKLGIRTGVDVFKMFDAAEDVVRPIMRGECALDRLSLVMGYAGVYSSFLKHAFRAAERYGVSGAELLTRAGERKLVGGQEDQLLDIAVELATETPAAAQPLVSGATAGPSASISATGRS
jgi:4-hydroxy 2-oxovalerate aldolase